MKTTTIWCSYHDEQQLIDYNLKETDIVKLFNTNDLTLKKDNINHLNTYLGEIVTYYYVWKNQIKSDYIGFCHYRRSFQNIQYDYIDDNHIQALTNGLYNIEDNSILDVFKNYIKNKYDYNIKNDILKCSMKMSFIMTWNVFNKICDLIFGFLDYISTILNTDWKTINGQITIMNYILSKKNNVDDWEYEWTRHIGVCIEFLLGCYINMFYDTDDFQNIFRNNIIILSDNNINQIRNCERLGILCYDIYIYLNSNEQKNIQYYNYDLIDSYINGKSLLKLIKENINHKRIIILNNNEYIDCKDSFEFYKGNYTIKQIADS